MFLAADLTLPMEAWATLGSVVLAGFAWLGKALLGVIEKQREAHREFSALQVSQTDKMIEALVRNSAAITALSERLGKGDQ